MDTLKQTLRRRSLIPSSRPPAGMCREEWAVEVTRTASTLLADDVCRRLFEIGLRCLPLFEGRAASAETFAIWAGLPLDVIREHLEHLDRRHYLERRYVWTPDNRRVFDGFRLQVPDYVESFARWCLDVTDEESLSKTMILVGVGRRVDEGTSPTYALYEAVDVIVFREGVLKR